jgi:N-carbamoyl-L-amino-acid hydrolase
MALMEEEARALDYRMMRITSGAGHDAQIIASASDAGMIFIPCEEGKSHGPEEAIRWEDATRSAQVLADSVIRIGFGERREKVLGS